MSIGAIGAIVFFGLLLIMTDIFFLAGTVVAGLIGLILLVYGIYSAFAISSLVGTTFLIGSVVTSLIMMLACAKIMANKNFGLQTELKGKVNEVDPILIQVGDIGEAFGDLRLNGRARINNELFDVESTKSYIDSGTEIKVVAIKGSKIMVESTATDSQNLTATSVALE